MEPNRNLPPFVTIESEMIRNEVAEQLDAQMRRQWDKVVCKRLGVPDTYQKVAVLIVHWHERLDRDLGAGDEVKELHELFRDGFNYESTIVTLHNRTRPQNQLNRAIAEFVDNHDGPNRSHLLILYYTGHGFKRGHSGPTERFMISGKAEPSGYKSSYHAEADWKVAEACTRNAEADLLTIMDCCYAGSIAKGLGDNTRLDELMAASGEKDVATMPGEHSYTRALIDTLRGVLQREDPTERRILTFSLNQLIVEKTSTAPHVYHRPGSAAGRHICLAPLAKQKTPPAEPMQANSGHLNLRIAFRYKAKLEDQEVDKLAENICKAAKRSNLGISAIDWMGFYPVPGSKHFKKVVNMAMLLPWFRAQQEKKRRRLTESGDEVDTPESKRRAHSRGSSETAENQPSASTAAQDVLTPEDSNRDDTPS